MAIRWKFRAIKTVRGNAIADWIGKDTRLRARINSFLRRLRELPVPWPAPYYGPLGDGIGELRVDLGNIEHRLYGFFGYGPNEFTVIIASSDKKSQQSSINAAKRRNQQIQKFPVGTEEYIV
jgi:putative component of toxin-antitoxin plasmid stabilization module